MTDPESDSETFIFKTMGIHLAFVGISGFANVPEQMDARGIRSFVGFPTIPVHVDILWAQGLARATCSLLDALT